MQTVLKAATLARRTSAYRFVQEHRASTIGEKGKMSHKRKIVHIPKVGGGTLKERLKGLLRELTAQNAVSGSEQSVASYMKRELEKVSDSVSVDHMGNVFAIKKAAQDGPVVMIAAHSDEIGAIVKSVDTNGYIWFEKIGGAIDALLVGRKVWVGQHLGVIGVKAGHLQSPKERSEVKKHTEMYVDVGATSREQVLAMGISTGTPIAYNSPLESFTNSDRMCGKAIDDRLGCAVLLELMRDASPPKGTLVAAVTVQEEVGLRGAKVAAFRVRPDFAIALDTMPCGDTPDVDFYRELPVGIGLGPAFQFTSGTATGFLISPAMKRFLTDTAKRAGVGYQVTTFPGGNTDATAIHLVREGIPTGVIALPRRYSHSPVEVADINDAVGALEILKTVVKRMAEPLDWSFV